MDNALRAAALLFSLRCNPSPEAHDRRQLDKQLARYARTFGVDPDALDLARQAANDEIFKDVPRSSDEYLRYYQESNDKMEAIQVAHVKEYLALIQEHDFVVPVVATKPATRACLVCGTSLVARLYCAHCTHSGLQPTADYPDVRAAVEKRYPDPDLARRRHRLARLAVGTTRSAWW